MQKIINLLIILLTTFWGIESLSAEYRSGRLYDSPAMVASGYTGFCQDQYGFIWIGTTRGLLRFDGNVCDVYRHDDDGEGSLSDSRILDVFCDSKGRIWVATANGLNLYMPDTDNFKAISLPSKTFYGYIIAIDEQSDGTVTFIASGVGLYAIKFVNGEPEAVIYTSESVSNSFNTIVCCNNGQMYFGGHDGIVYNMAANGKLTAISVAPGSYIVSMSLEHNGNILVGTMNAIYRINVGNNRVSRLSMEREVTISNLSNSSDGIVYVATSDRGLWQVNPESDTVTQASEFYCPFVNLENANIGAVFSAPDGNLWIGCNYKGLVMVPGQQSPFTYKRLADDFPDFGGGISAMALWRDHLVAALDRGMIGVFAPDGKMIRKIQFPYRADITSIEMMDDDKALLGVVGGGIWQLDLNTGALEKRIENSGKYPLVALKRGLGDDVFIGVHGEGVSRYNMKTGERIQIPYKTGSETGLSNPFLTYLHHSPDDKMWICTFSGLACYDLKTNEMIEVDQIPFLNGSTFAVASKGDSTVLAGTSQGLIHYDLKKGIIKKYTVADGLADNDVRSIAVDGNGGVWIGTVRGLSYLPAGSDKIESYYGGYGLVENIFNQAVYSPVTDRVYMGNDLGFTSFCPAKVPSPGFDDDVKVAALYLNGIRLGRKSADGIRDIVIGSDIEPDELHLDYNDNSLTLRMSTLDFRDASNVSYRWRLSGKDEWYQTPPGENLIYLPHLDPGPYNFEVCAFENNVMSQPTRIKILISAPWYLSIWAKLVYACVLLALFALGWLAYKKKQDEQINEEKIKFFMDLSHDLRSPLSLVLSPLESLIKQPFDSDVKSKLNTMHRNVIRMLNLVNQLLDIRKLEKGKMHLHCKKTDINAFVGELVEMFRPQADDKKQSIEFSGLSENKTIWIDRNNLDRILVNLISNAIKYTGEGGSVEVKLSLKDDEKLGGCLGISVVDTGIGLDSKTEAKLFERFYRVESDQSQTVKGFGIGLDLCRRLAMLHHGTISGKNREDGVKGSIFTVLIPLDENLYSEKELLTTDDDKKENFRQQLERRISMVGDSSSKTATLNVASKCVLFVDDDFEMRTYVASQLGRLYKVKTAVNGAEALKMMKGKTPDLIISDVMMPEMDGLTFLKRIKSNADTNHIPVILLSSKTSVMDRMTGWEKGADAYLEKPFNIEELQILVGTMIENRLRMKGKYSGAQETNGKIVAPEVKGNDEALMEKIIKEINAHIDDPDLNVEKLSDGVGMSRTHLHRKLKEMIGMTPSDYIRNIRLKRACELLKKGDIEVTQVAYKVGFTSQSHFSTHFKRYTGYTPSEYRANSSER